jgi:hypothetical protein
MINDLTIILQGRCEVEPIKLWIENYSEWNVIISTWIDSDLPFDFPHNWKIIKSEYPERYGNFQNLDYQVTSTLNGLQEVKTKYVVNLNRNNQPDMWVNFQQKGEYNPLHSHSGTLSFVIWVKIPYDLENEKNLPNIIRSNTASGPAFTFVHSGFSEQVSVYNIPIDKSYEGKMIIFPSWLQHMVSPFYTSNDFRISVSGNLVPVL